MASTVFEFSKKKSRLSSFSKLHKPNTLYIKQSVNGFLVNFFPFSCQGFYWIDPNGGLPDDAVKVRCEHRTKSTCLYPTNTNQVIAPIMILQ